MLLENRITCESNEYIIKPMSPSDEDDVQGLCERCSDFSMLIEGRMPQKDAGHEILFDLPPNKEQKDKFVIGAYKDNTYLIAVIDLIRDYKIPGEWMLGLMMLDPNERGKNLGRNLHEYVKALVSESQGRILRLGVMEENHRAHKFWSSLGYKEIDRVNRRFGNKDHVVIVMNYLLA